MGCTGLGASCVEGSLAETMLSNTCLVDERDFPGELIVCRYLQAGSVSAGVEEDVEGVLMYSRGGANDPHSAKYVPGC